ncbi:MAG: YihY/virulence factor BrkB family protein [Frankiaceae bacterium]
MSIARLDAYQRRHRWLGYPVAVAYKFVDDQGAYLAALITYYAFLSLFPLLLLLATVLGFALHDDPALQQRVVDSTLSQFPIIGTQLQRNVHSLHGSALALVVGIVGALYGGLGVAQAGQNALNRVWAVPRNERPNPFLARLRSLALLLVLGTGVIATTVLSGLAASAKGYGVDLGTGMRIAAIVLSVAVNIGLFVLAFRVLTARDIKTGDVIVGAVVAAVAWQVLQAIGTYYVGHELKHATEVYGLFGLVLGLIAWLWLESLTVVLAAEINVVRAKRLWPRALLTPFTDRARLTRADERAYDSYAQSERYKGFENVDVDFEGGRSDRDR